MRKRATATFEIRSWEETPLDETEGGPKLTRARVVRGYQGGIDGEGKLEYLMMYRTTGSAVFVGLERVTGRIGGRTGTFVLLHNGTFDEGIARSSFSVVAGSGTGELRGLRGEANSAHGHSTTYPIELSYDFE